MRTPTPPTSGYQFRSHAVLLLLLTISAGLGIWHHRQRGGQPTVAMKATVPPASAGAAPQSPAQRAAHVEPGRAVAGQSANVRMVAHPEEGPAWAVPYGGEFWRSSAPPPATQGSDTNPAPPFNIGEVIARVSHAFRTGDAGGLPEVKARTYTARFDESAGLGFSPHRPAASTEVTDAAGAKEPHDRRSRRPSAPHPATRPQPDPETEAWFRTMSVARDGQALFTAEQDTPAWSLLGNTAQGLLNEAVGLVAHYEARANGVEVSWVLPQAPPGTGLLVVESELSGMNYAGATEQGLHFADAAGVARVRVGPVTVVDAVGARWPLAMAAVGNRLRLEVPADLLAKATYPLAIDPALEAEFEMDKELFFPYEPSRKSPSVAAGRNGYLVVWEDSFIEGDIYGARVTTNGVVSDPKGIPICTDAENQFSPSVAASGSGFLVVWTDFRNEYPNSDIYGARVTTAGVVSETEGFPITSADNGQYSPSVTAGSGGYLVVWTDDRNGNPDIYGARVTTDGVVSDPAGLPIATVNDTQGFPSVAASGSGYLVVWEDRRNGGYDIYGARMAMDGVVSDPAGLPISTAANNQEYPTVEASSSGYLVIWRDHRNGNYDIYGARVTTNGVVSDPAGLPICATAEDQSSPSVAVGSNGYLVVWADYRKEKPGIFGTRVTTNGVVSEPTGFPISTAIAKAYQVSPSVAASGSGYLVAWEDVRYIDDEDINTRSIYGARVTTGGVVSEPKSLPIATLTNDRFSPSVAAGSSGYLVVWADNLDRSEDDDDDDFDDDSEEGFEADLEDDVDETFNIYGVRVTKAGVVSDPYSFPISTAANDQHSPSVAASGSSYLVVWQDKRNLTNDIYGTRVTKAGVVIETNGIPISTADNTQSSPSVAATSSGYLVVWEDNRNGNLDIYGTRVATDGVVSETNGIAISTATNTQSSPSVAATSSGYLVVWEDYRSEESDIYGARVAANGMVSDPAGLPIATAESYQFSPSVAAGSSGYLVVWEDYRAGNADIYGARVTTDGALPDPNGIAIATVGDARDPSVTATDNGFVVVWWDADSNSLFWHRLNPAGALLESSPLLIKGSNRRDSAVVAYGGAGRFLLTSDGYREGQRIIGSLHSTKRPAAGPVVAFKSAGFSVIENKAAATIKVIVSGHNPGLVEVDYATADGTAADGDDYEGQSGTLLFPKGTEQQTFTIPIATNILHEANETVNLTLSNPSGATLGLKHRAVLTIKDDDLAGILSLGAASYSVRESTHTLTITVKRTGGKASGVTVAYTTGGGTAVAGTHYAATAGTLTFAAGEKSQTFIIPITDNLIEEGKKTFFVHLLNPTGGATLGKVAASTVTILDDD